MAEDVKAAIAEMARESDGNPEVRAFLRGLKAGLDYNPAAKEEQPAAS